MNKSIDHKHIIPPYCGPFFLLPTSVLPLLLFLPPVLFHSSFASLQFTSLQFHFTSLLQYTLKGVQRKGEPCHAWCVLLAWQYDKSIMLGLRRGGEPCLPWCVLLGWQCDKRTTVGLNRGGEPCHPGCVLLSGQCGLRFRKRVQRGGALYSP